MTKPGLTVLAVDDEQGQLDDLARLIRDNRRVGEVETARTAHDALVKLARRWYDVILLDVRMPDLDGLALAKVLATFPNAPALVLVSAFDVSAVATFELGAVDFLMKPVTSERIDEALGRVEAGGEAVADIAEAPEGWERGHESDVIAVRDLRSRAMRLLSRGSILYVKAYGDYVRVYADSGRYLLRSSLSRVEERFARHGFLRIHRQYLANLARATDLRISTNGTAVIRFENGDEIPVARRKVADLRRRLHV